MKLGIYKPFKPVYFNDSEKDVAAWSYEVVNIAKIFAERGHQVYILSENDLVEGQINNIYSKLVKDFDVNEKFDRIFIWSGSFALDQYKDNIIDILRILTRRLDFVLTDKILTPEDKNKLKLFDNLYLQGTKQIFSNKDVLGSTSELVLYQHQYSLSLDESIKNKNIEFYFGGTERNRLDDYIEYVWRPGHIITTKSKFFNIENRVPRSTFLKNLDNSKYSVIITDVENNQDHFISPRPYECYIHDIIGFFDSKYDPDEYYCKKDDFRRVKNYKEMREKMNFLNEHPEKYKEILANQRQTASKPEFIDGEYLYQKFQ